MKTHPLNVSYLVVGLVFLGLAGSWALQEYTDWHLGGAHWVFPAVLIAAGVIGLVAFGARSLSGGPATDRAADRHDDPL